MTDNVTELKTEQQYCAWSWKMCFTFEFYFCVFDVKEL